ncbi:thioredoxin domain-containing protein 15-like [Uloborus diversus]|uniref:thioredoxin domain-containing protein 15-like n=1 Tax=Uloborus diversus TaxID=327109 RepID=UPI00240914CF|nr:thioredoxin domain-containing protein 15-like [Uloborus diversus]XP_054719620.1 thioredoxin domain-containing protein 15-like [Uloborus diversus]
MICLNYLVLSYLLFVAACADEEDVTVEFSSPEINKPSENAKNASQLILQEIEGHISERLLSEKTIKDGANLTADGKLENINGTGNSSAEGKNVIKVQCLPRVLAENEVPTVTLTNGSMFLKALTPSPANTSTGECSVVLFYSSQCAFSARMAPHFNALPRVFPDIAFYAVDILQTGNIHVRYGLVFVPNVMLFHNSKPVGRFNETTLNLEQFVKFIHKFTGLQHNGTLNVTSADMSGPVPSSIVKKTDYVLILAWAFTICCLCFGFLKSSICHRIVEFLKNTWQEAAAAQHEHED